MTLALLVILAVYAYIALEAWNLSHPRGPESGTFQGLARDIADLEVTPVEPLRLPSAADGSPRVAALTSGPARVA